VTGDQKFTPQQNLHHLEEEISFFNLKFIDGMLELFESLLSTFFTMLKKVSQRFGISNLIPFSGEKTL